MDLKIELRKLYGLHIASIQLEHGVRRFHQSPSHWKVFSPSRFIYTYFTFNSIYNFDWRRSFQTGGAVEWKPNSKGEWLKEAEKFGSVIMFYFDALGDETPASFCSEMEKLLYSFGILDPEEELRHIVPSNEKGKDAKKLRKSFPANFAKLRQPDRLEVSEYRSCLTDVVKYIYSVRNNIFHGSKTEIDMQDDSQQARLLIYSAILSAVNSLLFEVLKTKDIGWQDVLVHYPD